MPNSGISQNNLLVFFGFVRAGKTHAARLATLALKAVYLSTDVIQEQLINDGVIPSQERYTLERMEQVYDEFFAQAKSSLENGKNVVLDATFTKQESRDRVIKLAKETEANLFVFLVKCDEATIEERIKTGVVH